MPRVSDMKERLMDAAMGLMWQNGYGAASVDAICERAGAKKGSFYSSSSLSPSSPPPLWSRIGGKREPKWIPFFQQQFPHSSASTVISILSTSAWQKFKKNAVLSWDVPS